MSSRPRTKYGETFFVKKLGMEEQTFLGKFMGGCFKWGSMIRTCKGEVNSQEVPKVESS